MFQLWLGCIWRRWKAIWGESLSLWLYRTWVAYRFLINLGLESILELLRQYIACRSISDCISDFVQSCQTLCNAYFSLSLHFSITFNSHIIFWYCSSIGLFQGWKQSYLHTCCSGCKLISIAFWYQFVLKIICNFGDDQLNLMLICGSYFLRLAISQLLNNCRNLVGASFFYYYYYFSILN